MDFIEFCKLYRVRELEHRLFHARFNIHFRKQRVPEPSVPELGEWIKPLREEANDSQYARCREIERLCALLDYGNLDERKRRQVQRMLRRILKAKECIKTMIKELDATWKDAEHEYEKNKEIQERDKRVSDLYGKNMELDEENEKLKERCVKAKKRWWWDAWEPTEQGLEGIKREFVGCVKDLKGMADTVRDWCRDTGVKPEGVNIEGIKNEDLIIWVANECLWKKLPDGMREKICANKDHTMFSWENFKTTRKRLKQLKKRYVNAPTRSKNDHHREGLPMAREVDGA